MHLQRTIGVLEGLAEKEGLTYSEDVEKLAVSEETTVVDTGKDDISITICPGYMAVPKGINNLKHAFVDANYDAVLCTFNVDEIMKIITAKEEEQGSNIKIGAVDCFSQENHDEINTEDSFGNPKIDYIAGKYASMGGPAFAILYNAMAAVLIHLHRKKHLCHHLPSMYLSAGEVLLLIAFLPSLLLVSRHTHTILPRGGSGGLGNPVSAAPVLSC